MDEKLIGLARSCANTDSEQFINAKRIVCCTLNGFASGEINKLYKFGTSTSSRTLDIRNANDVGIDGDTKMKPRYFHSAISIYLLLKYPKLRSETSFINIALRNNAESDFMKISTDILKMDPDGT